MFSAFSMLNYQSMLLSAWDAVARARGENITFRASENNKLRYYVMMHRLTLQYEDPYEWIEVIFFNTSRDASSFSQAYIDEPLPGSGISDIHVLDIGGEFHRRRYEDMRAEIVTHSEVAPEA